MEPKPAYQTSAPSAETNRLTGTVKWFNREKGYGFIVPDGGGEETFVHYTAIQADGYRNLYEDDRVTYDLVDVGRGPQAQNVRLLHAY
ncbi:MAG: cold-shock protein [Chloroflexota bacterium]